MALAFADAGADVAIDYVTDEPAAKRAIQAIEAKGRKALALEGLEGMLPYPVKNDLTSATGAKYTGAVVQYMGDGVYDPHAIYSQLDAVKYQYGCFLSTFLASGAAVIPAPAALGTPCPN